MDTIRDRLAWALKQRQWSKRKLVRELEALPEPPQGRTYPSVHSYLREENPTTPPVETITALAKLLGVREEWLAFKKGAPTEHVEALLRSQDGSAMALQGALAGPEQGEQWGWIVALEPGRGGEATRRRAALLRFAQKLRDAEAPDAPWRHAEAHRDLLAAAHAFLAGTEAAFERAGGWDPAARTGAERLQGARDHLLVRDGSEGWYVAWSDAALDLFGRRVYGLGERPVVEMVPSAPPEPAPTSEPSPTTNRTPRGKRGGRGG